ncbi:MAG: tetratricopeptide repeat protein [Caulobacter sp.]|nr:tetratricopeptide repeat protein [Caulobacter sp.]
MGARILSFLLGVMLTGMGWAIYDPKGLAGTKLPPIDLGMLEGHRVFIGLGVLALGIASLLSAVLPRGGGPGGRKRRGPPVVDFDAAPDEPAAEVEVHHGDGHHASRVVDEAAEAAHVAHAEPAPEPATPPPQPQPAAEVVADQPFAALRDQFKTLVRAESWTEAAALARRLPASAATDEERVTASCDLGDFARSQGASDDAAEAYETALGYARHIHDANPKDVAAMASLAGVLTGVGDAAQDEARLDTAVEAYEEALALRRTVVAAKRDGANLRALSLALERLADAREDRGHRVRALDLYRESFDIAGKLAALDPQAYGEDLAVTRRRLAELEARLAL